MNIHSPLELSTLDSPSFRYIFKPEATQGYPTPVHNQPRQDLQTERLRSPIPSKMTVPAMMLRQFRPKEHQTLSVPLGGWCKAPSLSP